MAYIKTKGIIIKEVNTGEADKIVTIFSKSHGKISGFAKGARRPKSKFVAGTQFLCYSDLVMFKGRDMYSINSCDVIESFYEIRNDIVKLTYSAHIIEIINDVIQENQPSTRVLQLLLNTLHMLAKTEKSPELVTRVFEIRALYLLGYSPYVRFCMQCGNDCDENVYFSFKKCGFLCCNCLNEDSYAVRISIGAARAMQHIICCKAEDIFSFDVSEQVLKELGSVMKRYLRDRLEHDYTKLEYLKTLDI